MGEQTRTPVRIFTEDDIERMLTYLPDDLRADPVEIERHRAYLREQAEDANAAAEQGEFVFNVSRLIPLLPDDVRSDPFVLQQWGRQLVDEVAAAYRRLEPKPGDYLRLELHPVEGAGGHPLLERIPPEIQANPERRVEWINEWHERFVADLQRVIKMQYGYD